MMKKPMPQHSLFGMLSDQLNPKYRNHRKNRGKALKADRRLRTIAGSLFGELKCKLHGKSNYPNLCMNAKTKWIIYTSLLLAGFMVACSSGEDVYDEKDEMEYVHEISVEEPIPLKIRPLLTDVALVENRAIEKSFTKDDEAGLYVVNHDTSIETPVTLQSHGNHADNQQFTFNGYTWVTKQPIYWKDDKTPADIYFYCPYMPDIDNVSSVSWTVHVDQSAYTAYNNSDLLIGCTLHATPTDTPISITTRHVMSQMLVCLVPGNGFTAASLASAIESVKVNGIKTQATVDLVTGEVTSQGDGFSVKMQKEDAATYKAIIVPQEVTDGNLITLRIDGRDYNLKKAFTFVAGKRHKFTITVNRLSDGMNVSVSQWDNDETDHGGIAE